MKYGKLENLRGIDLSLPPDHVQTSKVLSGCRPDGLEIRVGGTMWTLPAWKGKVYPAKTPQRLMPQYYCEQFGCIELNATHYRIHPPETMRRWADFADDDFRFCPKFPQLISHFRRFNNCASLTDEFITALLALEHKCGPAFIQLPPNFAPKHAPQLIAYLEKWPRELRVSVEFRHPGWFTGEDGAEEVWIAMQEWGMGAVISDTAGRRDAVHMRCTAPYLLLRFGGNNLHPTDDTRLREWATRISNWHAMGLKEIYLLMHQPDSINTPESCIFFADAIRSLIDVKVKTPRIQQGLF